MTMKKIYCGECGTLVAELAVGSLLKTGTVHLCLQCRNKKKPDIPDFLKGMMKR